MEKEVPVMAVKKAFDLLETLHSPAAINGGMPLSEIARLMGMPANSARNILKTMLVCGYVEQGSDSRYLPGYKCLQMGRLDRMLSHEGVERIQRLLTEATAKLGEATVFTTLMGGNRVVVCSVEANRDIKVSQATILSESIFLRPTGRVLAAFASPAELSQILLNHGLPGASWEGIDSEGKLKAALDRIRESGETVDRGEEVIGFASPAFGRNGAFIGAIGCYAPLFRCPDSKIASLFEELKRTAAKIGEAGY